MDLKGTHAEVLSKYICAPQQNQFVQANQQVVLKNWKRQEDREKSIQFTVDIGQGYLTKEIEQILLKMRVGDIWRIKIINAQSETQIYLEVISAKNVEIKYNNNPFASAQIAKAEGNEHVKQKNYQNAIVSYQKAYDLLQYLCDQKSIELKLTVMSNLALSTLNTGKYSQCIKWCEKHSKQTLDWNKKVIYRQASAQKGLREWQRAKRTIAQALQFWKGEADIEGDFKQLLEIIEKQEKVQLTKQKKVYANMFK